MWFFNFKKSLRSRKENRRKPVSARPRLEYLPDRIAPAANLTPYQPSGWSDKIVVSNRTSTSTDDSPLLNTDTLYVDWAVTNNGTAAISDVFYTALYVDGTRKTQWSWSALAVGDYAYNPDYNIGSLSVGAHTVQIVADWTGVINESDETDNSYTKTITITTPGLPNLTPYQPSGWSDKIVVSNRTSTSTDDSPLLNTDTLYVDWAVTNNGTASTGAGFNVGLYVDGDYRTQWGWSALATGSNVSTTDASLGSLSVGTHTVQIVADRTELVNESEETDNSYTKTITVVAAAPSISSVSPASMLPSNTVQSFKVYGSDFDTSASHLLFTDPQGNIYTSASHPTLETRVSSTEFDYQINNNSDSGTWTVKVQNPDGQTSGSASFRVTALPEPSIAITSTQLSFPTGTPFSITGSVTDSNGVGIAGNVVVEDPIRQQSYTRATDAQGNFKIAYGSDVPSGLYRFTVYFGNASKTLLFSVTTSGLHTATGLSIDTHVTGGTPADPLTLAVTSKYGLFGLPTMQQLKDEAQKVANAVVSDLNTFSDYLGNDPVANLTVVTCAIPGTQEAICPALVAYELESLGIDGLHAWVNNSIADQTTKDRANLLIDGADLFWSVVTLDPVRGVKRFIEQAGLIYDSVKIFTNDAGVIKRVLLDGHNSDGSVTVLSGVVGQPSSQGDPSGYVYVDTNGNAVRDPGETGLYNVQVILDGTTVAGAQVQLTTSTNVNGFYNFVVDPGTYGIAITQPARYPAGPLSIGSLGGVAANNQFSQIVVPFGQIGTDYNFGEGPANPTLPRLTSVESKPLISKEGSVRHLVSPRIKLTSTNATIAAARIAITANYVRGEDFLSLPAQRLITSSFDPTTGILTLSGTTTIARYRQAMRAVRYSNTSKNPSTDLRCVSFQVDDGVLGNGWSNVVTRSIQVWAVNTAPVITVSTLDLATAQNTALALNGISVADIDSNGGLARLTLRVTRGTIEFVNLGSATIYDGANNSRSITLVATLSELNELLVDGNLLYQPPTDYFGTVALQLTLNDLGSTGIGGSKVRHGAVRVRMV